MKSPTLADITRMAQRLMNRFSRGERSVSSRALRDWRILLIVFVAGSALFIALSVYLYLQISKGDIFITEFEEQRERSETLDRSQLEEVLAGFAEREERFNTLQAAPPEVPGPF